MDEWELYPPLLEYWRDRGYHVASQVTDPRGSRFEIDVAAFTPDLSEVRLTEVKQEPSHAFLDQCEDRLRLASRVYAAVPEPHVKELLSLAEDQGPPTLGLVGIQDEQVEVHREAIPTAQHREEGPAQILERVLRGTLT